MTKTRLNPAARKSLDALGPSIYDQLKLVFIDSSEKFLVLLADTSLDAKTLERTAHSWKGIAQGMGATELSDLCLKLELIAAKSSAADRQPVIDAIREEYVLVKAELS